MTKKILQSKTKVGAVICGGVIIVASAGAYLEGALDGATATKQFFIGIGVILFGLGIRDALDQPKK